jgi:cation:H+ antiporter
MIILYLLIFVILCFALIKSGEYLVKILVSLSKIFKLTEFVIACLLMTFATTLPELIVGITSSAKNIGVISLGNIVGSNLVNLTLILGLVAVVSKGMRVESKIAKKDAWIIFFISLLPLFLLLNKTLSRGEGLILLIVFGWYVWRLLKQKESFQNRTHNLQNEINTKFELSKLILYFILTVVVLILSAWGLIEIAKLIALELYIPLAVVSIILVAVGTSLPELIFGIKSAILKHEGMCLGNLIGSVVVNSLFILGITAIINPIRLESLNVIMVGAVFMLVAILLSNIFLSSGRKVSVKEGWILIGFYISFLVVEFLFK